MDKLTIELVSELNDDQLEILIYEVRKILHTRQVKAVITIEVDGTNKQLRNN